MAHEDGALILAEAVREGLDPNPGIRAQMLKTAMRDVAEAISQEAPSAPVEEANEDSRGWAM